MSEQVPEVETEVQETEETKPKETPEEVKKLRREAANYRTQLRNAEQERDNALGELEKARGGSEETGARVTDLERENAKLKVALDKGIPKDLVSRLVGNTEEELAADADVLLTMITPVPTGNHDNGTRTVVDPPDLKTQIAEAEKVGNLTLSRQLKSRLVYEQGRAT